MPEEQRPPTPPGDDDHRLAPIVHLNPNLEFPKPGGNQEDAEFGIRVEADDRGGASDEANSSLGPSLDEFHQVPTEDPHTTWLDEQRRRHESTGGTRMMAGGGTYTRKDGERTEHLVEEPTRIEVSDANDPPMLSPGEENYVVDPEKARAMALAGQEERNKAVEARVRNRQYETEGWAPSTIGEAIAERADHSARHLEREAEERYDEQNRQDPKPETGEAEIAAGTSFMDRLTDQEPTTGSDEPGGPTVETQTQERSLKETAQTALREIDEIMDEKRPSLSPLALKALDEGRRFLENVSNLDV